MLSKQTEQRAEILKIAGFALITPFGRIFIEPMIVIKEFNSPWIFAYVLFVIFIAIVGLEFIVRSCDILSTKGDN